MKMGLKIELVLGLFCLLVNSEIHCLRWSSGPDQQVVLRACAGTTLSLPWGAIVNQGESIDTVRWFYSGRSDEMIATYTFGNVFATPTYCGRAHKTTNAGIDIDHVTALESGNYSVEVVVRDSHGDVLTLLTFVIVSIEDGLQTTDGQLHVAQDPVAKYSDQTGQYHVALQCGTFTYPSNPPFSATWQTPYNQTVPSSSYQAGSFQLLLPNPVEGGSYVCSIPPALACVHSGSGQAVLAVDATVARLAVLDTKLHHLEQENSLMKTSISSLQAENNNLKATVNTLQSGVSTLQTESTGLNTKVSTLQTGVNTLQTDNSGLKTKVNTLQSGVSTLQTENTGLNTKVNTLQTGVNTLQTYNSGLNTKVSTLQTGVNTLQTDNSGLKTKVSTLQAGVSTLQTENTGLNTKVNTLQTGVNTLQTGVNTLQTGVNTLQTGVNTLQTENTGLNTKVSTLQTGVNALQTLKVQVSSLETSNTDLRQRMNIAEAHERKRRVSFHATLNENVHLASDTPLVFPRVITNQGNAYNPATGHFVAPFSGVYSFLLSSETGDGPSVSIRLYVNAVQVNYFSTISADKYGTASAHAVVHMYAGQHVHVNSGNLESYFYYESTYFSGFMLYTDP